MNTQKLVLLIDKALDEADKYVVRYYHGDQNPMAGTKKVLQLLKTEVLSHPDNIHERVLRAMTDIDGLAVKAYESTELGEALFAVSEVLYTEIPNYKNLQPLRMDFDKCDPI